MSANELFLFACLAVFFVFMVMSSRKRKAQISKLESSVKVGAKAVMLGGITGKIVAVKDDSVIVETTPGTKIEFLKGAVRSVVEPSLDEKPESTSPKSKPAAKKTATKSATTKKSSK